MNSSFSVRVTFECPSLTGEWSDCMCFTPRSKGGGSLCIHLSSEGVVMSVLA